jgi:hypothetical protein
LPIKFEFTGRATPQRNHLAEVGFATLAARGRAIMSSARIPKELCQMFWQEAFQTSTLLDGLVLVNVDGVLKTRIEHWEGKLPSFVQYLRKWGEAEVVKLQTSTTPKIYDRGKVCMFVGYSRNHAGDTLHMWDPETKRVHLSRDIVWLNKMYFNNTTNIIDIPNMPYMVIENILNNNPEFEQDNDKNENGVLEIYNTFSSNEFIELLCVGAGIGEGILHTGELHVLKYKDAMNGKD